jgi:hypothetical protein
MLGCEAVYGGRLWRPVLNLEFARLVQQSLGTSAFFLSYVFVDIIIIIFRVHLVSSKWCPKRRVAYIHVGEPSELRLL